MDRTESERLRAHQNATLSLLFVGYVGYYVCRSVLPVASTMLPIDKVLFGRLITIGIAFYALGKLTNGVVTEYIGGRMMFILGMVTSALFILLFAAAGWLAPSLLFLSFAIVWGLNRFVQSMGWVGLIQITGRWYAPAKLPAVMGILSLSYLFGDAAARLYLGAFAAAGVGWQGLFVIAAATLLGIAILNWMFLKSRPAELGLPEPPPPPANLHGDDHGEGRVPLKQLLSPLFRSRMFWLVCMMNAGLTTIRETFNSWTPNYLKDDLNVNAKWAGLLSFVFPLAGAVASLAAGLAVNRVGGRYGRIMLPMTLITALMLELLIVTDLRDNPVLALILIGFVALFVMGPYTFCSGVLALNLGGKRAGAASAGIIDAAGYLCGAVISGELAGQLVQYFSYSHLFSVLCGIAVFTSIVTAVYWFFEHRQAKSL